MVDAPQWYSVPRLECRLAVLTEAERALLKAAHGDFPLLLSAACWASVMLIREVTPAIRGACDYARQHGAGRVEERPINVFQAFNKVPELRRVGTAAHRAAEREERR